MKWFTLWDCVELDGSRWQIIADEDDRYVLRSLDGPGVRILQQGDLFAGAVPDPRTDQTSGSLANLDLTSMLSYAERERIDVLADHLHEVWHGVRSRAPIGTRPRPEYDPTTQTLLARKQAKAVELAAVGTLRAHVTLSTTGTELPIAERVERVKRRRGCVSQRRFRDRSSPPRDTSRWADPGYFAR